MVSVERAREILEKESFRGKVSDEQLQNIITFLYSLCSKVAQKSLPNLFSDDE